MPGLDCACGSGARYAACCRPYHRGEREPLQGPALVRSRFCAFALGNADYLRKTLHPDHEDAKRTLDEISSDVRRAARVLRYRSVRILDERATATGAEVLFLALIFQSGKDRSFVEKSELVHDGQRLLYRSGVVRAVAGVQGDAAALSLESFR